MGTRIDSFDFRIGPPVSSCRYPLGEWMDGSIWEIVRGEDFEGTTKQMQSRLHFYARSRGYRVQTACRYEVGRQAVIFRFRPDQEPPR